jgi:polysaccharide export outer membrane protein
LELKIMQIRNMNCTLGSLLMAFILGFALIPARAVAQDNIPNKLVQYVQDAKKSGQKQAQVQRKAIKAGWSETAVRDAVTFVYGTSNPALVASVAAEPSLNAGAQLQPGTSGGPSAAGPDVTGQTPNNVAQDSSKKKSARPALSATQGSTQDGINAPAGTTASPTVLHVPYEYRIGAGDALQIAVWKEPEASATAVVRPDGMISTPLVKEIQVAGLTPTQAEKLITEKLVKVIQEPDVTVVVTGINSKKIYAIGAVKKEGPISYTYSMTVMQAIAEAGGLTDYAKRKKIYVLRNENGKESKFIFAYDEVLRGNRMELNIIMLPGDTLVVPH